MREWRYDPIQKRWIIISTTRQQRPVAWQPGEEVPTPQVDCPFCEGRESETPPEVFAFRTGGPNEPGWRVRVVPNKFAALQIEGELERRGRGMYDRIRGIGAHEVIIESPDHECCLSDQTDAHISLVLSAYRQRLRDLMSDTRFRYVLVFKNHGREAGMSLSHPHSQVIAMPVTPRTVAIELQSARDHYARKERCIFCDILDQELEEMQRVVELDDDYATLCPYASRFPYEMALLPRRHMADFATLTDNQLSSLARHLKRVLQRMKHGLGAPAYNLILHTAPNTSGTQGRRDYWVTLGEDWHWHIEIFPRLTRVAGFEWGSGFYINPQPPEEAAARLRAVEV